MKSKARTAVVSIMVVGIASLGMLSCSTSTAPKSCVELAREAGVPEQIVEYVEKPDGLNSVQRIAVRKALEEAGLDEACGTVLNKVK